MIYINDCSNFDWEISFSMINREMEDECIYFRRGMCDVVPILRMFSWREMQTLISGSDKPIDIGDWMEHTNYTGGYTADHPCIQLFWQVSVTNASKEGLEILNSV